MPDIIIPPKTPEEIQAFLTLPDIDFKPSKSAQAYKTNMLLFDKNFSGLKTSYNNMMGFLKYFYSLVDVGSLLQNVLDLIVTGKDEIPIASITAIGSFTLTEIGSKIYKCLRQDQYTIVLTQTNNPNWNVTRLMVQVKEADGTIVYPVIKTAANSVTINFADGIGTNYNIYLI
jgi:hypothetical protein